MTVSSTNTRELDIDRIILRAHQLAGLVPAEHGIIGESRSAMARDFLEMDIKSIQTGSPLMRKVELYDLPITASTSEYSLPAGTLDIIDRGSFSETGDSAETPVIQMARQDYVGIQNKGSTGRPTRMYVRKGSTVTVTLWPVPSAAGTLKLQRQTLLADNNDGASTVDLEIHWTKFVVLKLASRLAEQASLPSDKVLRLQSEAMDAEKEARRKSMPQVQNQMIIDHGVRYRRL